MCFVLPVVLFAQRSINKITVIQSLPVCRNRVHDFFGNGVLVYLTLFLLSFSLTLQAQIISTGIGGDWNASSTWVNGVPPGPGDDVIIANGAIVTISNASACKSLEINGALSISSSNTLQVNGNWINNGTFTANTSAVTFGGTGSATISGSSSSAFHDLIINKGVDVNAVIEANGGGALSNTGTLIINNGLFKMTTGTFKFGGNSLVTIPVSGGIWVNGATFNSGDYSITNEGLIRVSAGTAIFGTQSGNSVHTQFNGVFEVTGGAVNIAGRLENTAGGSLPGTTIKSGITISGGTVTLSTVGNGESGTGTLDVSTFGYFDFSGGTIIFKNASSAINALDLHLVNGSGNGAKSITGGTFELGNADTPTGSTFLINSEVPLLNLTTSANANIALDNDLIISGTLDLHRNLVLNDYSLRLPISAPKLLYYPLKYSSGNNVPLNINITGGTFSPGAYIELRMGESKHPQNANNTNFLKRYWTINTNGISNLNYSLEAHYLDGDVAGNEASFIVGSFNGSNWINRGNPDIGANTIAISGITDNSASFTAFSIPTVGITPSSTTICNGSSVTLLSNASGDPLINYSWTSSPSGFTSTDANVTVSPALTTIYTVTVTDGNGFTATANGTVTVTPANTITLSSGAGTDNQTKCISTAITPVTYSTTGATGATISGLPTGLTGAWAADVVTIGGTSTTSGSFPYTVTLTGGCGNITTAGTITVTPNNTITLTSAGSTTAQTVCINTSITNITYSTTGATGATISGLPTGITGGWAADVVTISGTPSTTVGSPFGYTITLTGGCGVITTIGSISVIPLTTPTVTISANPGSNICAGTSVTFTATPTNAGTTPLYQWKLNGTTTVGTNSNTFTTSTLVNTDKITVVITSDAPCPASATSNEITMTVNSSQTPTVTITESANPICQGAPVTFTAIAINGGSSPSYQWQVNGALAGSSTTFTTTSLANNDQVNLVLTSSALCAINPATSNIITMRVDPVLIPSVTISASETTICPGTPVTFTAVPTNGGTSPAYQWTLNSGNVGTNSPTFSSSTLANGNAVSVVLTSNATCASPVTANSNSIAMTVNPATPSIPGTISGLSLVCPDAAGITYSIAAVPNATAYTWTVPAGWAITGGQNTTTITVTAGITGQNGDISVSAGNSCGTSAEKTVAVTVGSLSSPPTGVTITNNNTCSGTSKNLSVTGGSLGTGATWQWFTGSCGGTAAGTGATIVVNPASGTSTTYYVRASGTCNTTLCTEGTVVVSPGAPVQPGAITGSTPVCPGITGLIYSITAVPDATSYTWTVPSGWSIAAGAGTNSIIVTSGSAGQNGNISVTASNSCGISSLSTQAVTVSPGTPATPGIISGAAEQCINKTGLIYSIVAVPNASSYDWTVPTGWSITSGTGTTSITVSTGAGALGGNITVAASNSCGTSGAQTLAVIANTAIPPAPAVPTGPTSICDIASGLVFTVPAVASATSYNWQLPSGWNVTAGSGTNTITVVLTAGAQNGDQNITVTAGNSCGTSAPSAVLTVAVGSFATADAGIDQTICFNTPNITVNGTPGGAANKNKGTWSTSGTGVFGNATKPGPTSYTPSAADKTAGNVTLTFTTEDPAGSCGAASDFLILTIRPVIIAGISGTTTICSGSSSTITFASSSNTTITYILNGGANQNIQVNGTGTATLNTGPLAAGIATYNLVNVSYTTAPTCIQALSGSATVMVNPIATVNAGADETVCSLSPAVTLAGSIGGSATSGTWSGGSGTFNPNNTTLNAVYTPTATEIEAGTVNLTLTTDDPAGPCPAASDQVVILINPAATANAGTDQIICAGSGVTLAGSVTGGASSGTWSGGTGSFTPNANTLNAVYTPTATEITAGIVSLTLTTNDPAGPCSPATDQVLITINPQATINAGPDQTICAGSTFVLAGYVGGGASSGTWSGGAGTFNPDNTTLNAIYTPTAAETTAGGLTLTLSTNDPTGPCPAASDQVILTINPNPTANAGADLVICAGSTATLAGLIGGSAISGTWSGGTGSFSPNPNTLNAVYTPGAADIAAGSIILTLTTNDPGGVCTAVSDQVSVTINPLATVSAGPDQTICSNTSATMAGSFGGGATSGTWSTNKNGTFNNNSPSAIYTPGNADINSGSVTLTYTTNDPAGPCGQVSSSMTLTIMKAVVITDQPSNTGVCESNPAEFRVGAIGDALSYQWYKGVAPGGTSVLNSSNITGAQSTILHFNQASLTDDGSYYVVVSGASPCSPAISIPVTLNVDKAITITTQPSAQTVCIGTNVTFSVVADANGDPLTYQWFKGIVPGGTPVSNSGTVSGAQTATLRINNVVPGDAGNYYAVITGQPGYTCTFVNSAVALLTVTANVEPPVFASGATSTRCQGAGIVTYSASASNSTGITYGLDATSTGSGNSINTSTGAVTYVGTWSGISIITATAAGCNGPANATHTVTVNPTVGTPATPSPSNTTICQASNQTTYSTFATDATSYTWSVTGAGNTITGTGTTATVSWAAGFSGPVTISVQANGCNGPSASATTTVSVTPTVGTPTAPSPPNTTICQASAPTTYTTSANNATSYTWSITGSGNSITGTGTSATVNWAAGFTGSATVSVQANGCNGPSASASSTVTVTPTVLTPVFSLGATSTRCQGTGSVTYTATATNTTGITYTLDAASITGGNSIIANTGVVTYSAGWNGTTTITASAAGCNGPVTATHTVNINPTSNGGTISPAISTVCTTTNSGTLTLSGQFGTITSWESSSNGGISWATISNTSNIYNFSNLPQTTIFRAVIQSGVCPIAYSSIARVDVIPVFTPIITATAGDLCAGQSTILTATIGGIVPPGPFTGGLFNQANPEGWIVTSNGVIIKFPASADNTNIGPWSETNGPKIFNGIEYNSGDGKFAIVNGNTNSTLETPVFSLLAMPTAVLTWQQAYNLLAGTTGRIELSLDGGLTYNIVLAQYTGPTTFGNPIGFNSMNIDLASYLGQSNMRIRFNYTGSAGSTWAIDNVGMPGQQPDITYIWSPTATLSPPTGSVVTATPGSTTTYTLTMYIAGCPGTATVIVINVVNNPVVTTTNACVGGGTVTFTQSNGPPGDTWTVSGGGTITSDGVFTPTTAGCFNATYTTAAASCSDTKSFVVFPAAPVLISPLNTCAAAFILPVVATVSGFTTEYSIDGGAFTSSPSLPSSYGCHTISARYLLTGTCGTTAAGSTGTGPCGPGNTVNVVIFPPAPPAPIVNAGCGPIIVTSPPDVPGFTIEYSFNDGGTWGANNPPTNDNCTGYRIKTRYVTSTACGAISAGTASPIVACSESPATLRTLDITAPSITFCPPAQSFCEVSGNLYAIPALSATDICSGTLEITYQITGATTKNDGAGNNASGIYSVGISTITWTVKDQCGNTSTCTTQVTINQLPVTSPIYHQ